MSFKILLTTPDYPPKRGGLSTFTTNLEHALRPFGEVSVYVWDSVSELKSKTFEGEFDWGIHIHFMGGVSTSRFCKKNINFVHGSEVAFTSPNLIKKIVKKILKKRFLEYFEKSFWNVFISEFTRKYLVEQGLKSDFSRDLVFHNLINIDHSHFRENPLEDEIRLVCIARDVPHKNIDGAIDLARLIRTKTQKKVILTINAKRNISNDSIQVICLEKLSDAERERIYQNSHFNLLPSLNHSKWGFFEGFGLTVLEAGKYGAPSIVFSDQGGQGESVHHLLTGWSDVYLKRHQVGDFVSELTKENYQKLRESTFTHTHQNHDSHLYLEFFKRILS